MGMSVISSNTSLKVNREITAATTVNANCYAVVEYYNSGYLQNNAGTNVAYVPTIHTRHFGPAQAIPANFALQCDPDLNNPGSVAEVRYVLLSGVEFINSP